jgi:hypothetical protein
LQLLALVLRRRAVTLATLGTALVTSCGGASTTTTAPLGQTGRVGPAGAAPGVVRNVQATTDNDGHAEPSLAIDPRDPRVLLGAAQFLTPDGNRLPGTFVSTDGGQTWHDNGPLVLPTGYDQGIDTTTAFQADGVGYICAFALANGASSFASRSSSSAVLLWRTTDGGRTFTAPIRVYRGAGFQDHPWLAAGSGRTLYLAWTNRSGLVFSRSTDGGASFSAPNVLVRGPRPANPVVIAAGRFVDVFYEEAHPSTLSIGLVALTRSGQLIRSTPGIASGAAAVPSGGPKRHVFFPLFAATASVDGTVLAVAVPIIDHASGHPAIELWHSSDQGRSWQGPSKPVSGPAAFQTQLQPQLGMVGHGLVASFFTETRTGVFNRWFTAATGTSFAPARLVSTEAFHASGWIGDYQALATTGHTVHLAWNDGRTGHLQIFSATISDR